MSVYPEKSEAKRFRREFNDIREAGEDLSLDSQTIRESQVAKTSERLEVVRKLRAESLARSVDQRIGLPSQKQAQAAAGGRF